MLYVLFIIFTGFLFRNKRHLLEFTKDNVVALIVAKNEGDIISQTITSIKNHIKNVVVVSDNSSDDTVFNARFYASKVYEVCFNNKDKAIRFALSNIIKDYSLMKGVFIFDGDSLVGNNFDVVFQYLKSDVLNFISPDVLVERSIFQRFSSVINSFFVHLQKGFMVVFGRCFVGGYGLFIPYSVIPAYVGFETFSITEDIERLKFKCNFIDEKGVLFSDYPEGFKGFFRQRLRWFIGTYQVFFIKFKDIVKTFYLLPFFISMFLLPVSLLYFCVSPLGYIINAYLISPLYFGLARSKIKFIDILIFPFMLLLICFISFVSLFFPSKWYSAREKKRFLNEKVVL